MIRNRTLVTTVAWVCLVQSAVAAPQTTKKALPATKTTKTIDPLATHLKEAQASLAARDFPKALELFRQVEAISPSAVTKLGIAECLHGIGKLTEAYDAYEQILREQGATLSQNDFHKVEQSIAALRASTAQLGLQLTEPGAQVKLDGVDLGISPIDRSVRRVPGIAKVTVTKTGFVPFVQNVELRAGEDRKITVQLVEEKVTAKLVARSTGNEPAILFINGKEVGPLPYYGDLPAGTHELMSKNAQGQSVRRSIAATPQGNIDVELSIIKVPAKLHVAAADTEARILVDGTAVASGRFDGELTPGSHVVTVEKENHKSQVLKVTLEPGERASLDNISLERLDSGPKGPTPADYKGLYGQLTLDGLLGRPNPSLATNCPVTGVGGSCKSWLTFGGALDARVGNSFGLLGAEGFLLLGSTASLAELTLAHDVSKEESAWYGVAHKDKLLFVNPLVAFGLAGRISSQSQTFRLSTAWGVGVAWRESVIARAAEALPVQQTGTTVRKDANTQRTTSDGKFLPILIWDADFELGSTPGLKLLLGLHCQLEFGEGPSTNFGAMNLGWDGQTGEHLPAGGGNVRPWGSPSFFIGPRLGVAMGH